MLTTQDSYRLVVRNLDKSLKDIANRPDQKRETDYFLKNIQSIKTVDGFLANDRVYRYAMKAFGLQDMIYAKAFVKKVLVEGNDSAQSFSNQLTDPRFKDLVATFNFKSLGSATTSFTRAQTGVVDKYIQQKLEENAGSQNEGVRLALYFRRKAPDIRSAYSILADPALLKVVQTTLALPQSSSNSSIETQSRIISEKLNIKSLHEPEALEKFVTKFTHLWELNSGGSAAASSSLAIFQPQSSVLSPSTLLSLQSLRRR